ncbi:hypothetical protein [Aquamicrobium sp. LC103]|uniref:hypothetical protein n=1 Tax=Aquamicrobium sp. LC103 TaxID=1120658 RepID=UPI00063E6F94|nr:hypothetical protein [Aquamicrobium sp. LC103]TKT75253.1 hypothetical protein XW59_019140 [Aquamicrobium sp. LC103]
MLSNLDAGWLIMAIAVVGIFSFIFSMALDAIMGRDGFGPTGNAVILTAGFFLSLFLAEWWGLRLAPLTFATAIGLGGAFVCLTLLTVLKAALDRFSEG